VRFSPEERARLRDQAQACGLSLSAVIRAAALSLEVRPRRSVLDTELVKHLAAASNNLNQLAHSLNAARQRSFQEVDWPRLEVSVSAIADVLIELEGRSRYDR
jgi:hypothetical protein